MRRERVIAIAGVGDVRVREARVSDMRALLELLPTQGENLHMLMIHQQLPALLAILGDGLELPKGRTLDQLSMSELDAILAAWWALHADFFARALAAFGLELASATQTSAPSTAPSPPSASEAA